MHHYPPTQYRTFPAAHRPDVTYDIAGTIVYSREDMRGISIPDYDCDAYTTGTIVPVYRSRNNQARYTLPLWREEWYLCEVADQIIPIPSNAPADNNYQPVTTQGAPTMSTNHTFNVENDEGIEVEVQLPLYPEYEHCWLNVVMNWSGGCYTGKSDFIRDVMDETSTTDSLPVQNQRAVEMVVDQFPHCFEEFVDHLGGSIIEPEKEEQWHPKAGDLIAYGEGNHFYVVLRGSGDDYKTPFVTAERDCDWFWVGVVADRERKVAPRAQMSWGCDAEYYTKVED